MNKFEKQLEKWNNGILRGAQSKLAKRLHVSTATVALWATGQRHPSKGYVSKMAHLFKLDVYEVTRLFDPQISYPTTSGTSHPIELHDAKGVENPYFPSNWHSHTNTVSLPVFTQVPPSFPYYATTDALEYWVLPTSATQGAQYLFLLPTKDDPIQLLFIKPSKAWVKGRPMLARKKNTYQLISAKCTKQTFAADLEPVGIIVRQLIRPR